MEFSVGNAIGTSLRVWFRNFIPFALLSVVLNLPVLIWTAIVLAGEPTLGQIGDIQTYGTVLSILLNTVLTATLTYGVVMELRGRRASIGASLTAGLARFLPALVVGFLVLVAIVAGLILLIVPGLIVACLLFVAMPASVIERPGIVGALKRSAALTRGYRLAIFGLVLLLYGEVFLAAKILDDLYLDPVRRGLDVMGNLRTYAVVQAAQDIVSGLFGAVLAAVTYVQLRQSQDRTTAAELAKVFD